MRRAALFALLTLGTACATTQASAPILEPLEVPPVPARVIVPEIDESVAAAAEESSGTRPAATRPADPARQADRTETKPGETPVPPRPTEEAPRVRTPQTANDEQADRQVRTVMSRAQAALLNVDYRTLSAAARQQYDTAKRFIAQADSALTIRNYVFARNLADKADTLARQLGK
ncbi:MAG: hypothetical protein M3Q55_12005 [Acidobacteriota bacterium]|nr:hypothetical protein [Acidobacteriota bacterium]